MTTRYLAVNPIVDWLSVDDEVLAYDGELLHFLPRSAAEIWHALKGHRTLDDLVTLIAERHPESPEAPGEAADFVWHPVPRHSAGDTGKGLFWACSA